MANMNLYSRGDKMFVWLNMFLIGVFTLSTLYPFIYIAAISLSTGFEARAGNVVLTPVDLTFAAYKYIVAEPEFWRSYLNTFIYTIGGTLMSLAFIIPGAYALWAMVLLQDQEKVPLQVYLRHTIATLSDDQEFSDTLFTQAYSVETVTAAIIVCSIIPVLLVYPFLQKYFNKGILLGGVKE